MTEFTLWRKRLIHLTQMRFREFQVVVDDWMVWVYFVLPGLVFGGLFYREALLDPPQWFQLVPPIALFFLVILRGWLSFYRVYLSPADANFLLAGPWHERNIIYFSLAWHGVKEIGLAIFLSFLLYPYLHNQMGFTIGDTALFALLLWMSQILFLNLNWFIRQIGKKTFMFYQLVIILILVQSATYLRPLYSEWNSLSLFLILGVGVLISLCGLGLQKKWDWPWLIQESVRRNRPMFHSFMVEPEELKNKKYTKAPFLPMMQKNWSNKVDLFSVSRELSFKMFFRRSSQWRYVLTQLIGGCYAIWMFPTLYGKGIILVGIVFLMFQLLSFSQKEVEKRLWHRISPIDINGWREGKKAALAILLIGFGLIFLGVFFVSI